MTSKITNLLSLFLVLNFVFFSLVSSCGNNCGRGSPYSKPHPKPSPGSGSPGSWGTPGTGGSPGSGGGGGGGGGGGFPGSGGSPGTGGTCPIDALKLGVCANVLNGLLNITIGTPPRVPCCSLLQGLVDAEVAVCLCTAIRANILGLNLNIPLSLSLLVNYCGRQVPRGFQCP